MRRACDDVAVMGSARLLLLPATVALIDALVAGDKARAEADLACVAHGQQSDDAARQPRARTRDADGARAVVVCAE